MSDQRVDVDPGDARPPDPSGQPELPTPAPPPAETALVRYRRSMRRRNRGYYAVIALIVAAAAVIAGVAWSHGEVAHASLHTHTPAPPSLTVEPPTATQSPAWRSGDRLALGTPQWGGTVVTFSAHTVGGRDAQTGARTWSYTRTDRTVCTAAQAGGTTVAIYALHGNCDELTALDSGTGARRWTRTLDMDGMPINGTPDYQVTSYTVLVSSPGVVYALDPSSGYNRWTFHRNGCRIEHAVLGSSGALISQNCSGQVDCSNVKFCGRGPQLLLRDGMAGRGDDSKPNADQVKWNLIENTEIPVSADDVISAVDPSGQQLSLLDPTSGRVTGRVALHPRSAVPSAVTAAQASTAEVLSLAGTLYAVRPSATAALWSAPAPSVPTISSAGAAEPTLAATRITVVDRGTVTLLQAGNGHPVHRFVLSPAIPVDVGYQLGTGFLLAGPDGMVAYR